MTGAILLLSHGLGAGAEEPVAQPEATYRTVQGQVVGIDGKPVEGEQVLLFGLDRYAFNKVEDLKKSEGWNFTTDQDGRFTVKLGRFAAEEFQAKTQKWLPGWGEFFLVVLPDAKHAGGVSARLLNFSENIPELPEETWGNPQVMSEGINEVTVQLRAGTTVTGKVQDTNGNSVPDLAIDLEQELLPKSKNGVNAQVFSQTAKTDHHGYVEFKNVYPAKFHLGFADGPPYWVQTRLGGQWQDGIIDEFEVPERSREILIGIVVSSQKIYQYYGKVTDIKGKPIPGAQLVLGISQHRRVKTDRDQNDFVEVTAKSDGGYEIRTETPWVRGFTVRSEGYVEISNWPEGAMFKPGQYNFLLKNPK